MDFELSPSEWRERLTRRSFLSAGVQGIGSVALAFGVAAYWRGSGSWPTGIDATYGVSTAKRTDFDPWDRQRGRWLYERLAAPRAIDTAYGQVQVAGAVIYARGVDGQDGLAKAGRNVRYHGPYDNARVDALMRAQDVVLVPSVWWENSPVVIQEARRNRVPVICSDIGGMAEKVRDGIDGLHFRAGSAEDLADKLSLALTEPALWERLVRNAPRPLDAAGCAETHLALYRRLLGGGLAEADPSRTGRQLAQRGRLQGSSALPVHSRGPRGGAGTARREVMR